jgi:predicted nucleic acid-binding protein
MMVVDTTVWIDHLNESLTPQVALLRRIISAHLALLAVGDLILCEILQGLRSDREAQLVARALRQFTVVPMVTEAIAVHAAANYRTLRSRGVTVRKTIDMLIGTFCIAHRHSLLHSDRDYDPMERHLGLKVVHP